MPNEHGSGLFPASKANDGIYDVGSDYASMAHSSAYNNPWWRVNLLSSYCVHAVRILNRARKLLFVPVAIGYKALREIFEILKHITKSFDAP